MTSQESSMMSTKMNAIYRPWLPTFIIPEPVSWNEQITINDNISYEDETNDNREGKLPKLKINRAKS